MTPIQDPYSREIIRNYLDLKICHISGSLVKHLLVLGDRFAVTCSMVLTETEWSDPTIKEHICFAAQFIFRESNIARDCPRDREPIYTIFLLEILLAKAVAPLSREQIETALVAVRGSLAKKDGRT